MTRRHVKDYGFAWSGSSSRTKAKPEGCGPSALWVRETLAIIREEMKRHSSGPIFRGLNGKPWTGKPCTIETLARLMGNSVQVCRDHYLQWCESYNEPLWEAC